MNVIMGFIGIITLVAFAILLSSNRRAINKRTVLLAFAIQASFGIFVLYLPVGKDILLSMANGVQWVINSSHEGISFLFGGLVSDKMAELFGDGGFIFALKVLPVIIFFSSLIAVLYYLGIMQKVIAIIGGALQKLLRISKPEAMSATANIFVGLTEAPLVVRPFIGRMSESQLFAVMVGGTASVAGSILVGYAALGIDLKYLIAGCFMAAPGGLLMAKLIMPEQGTPIESVESIDELDEEKPVNIIDAAAGGAAVGIKLAINVGGMLLAFLGLIALLNGIVMGIASLLGFDGVTIELLLGYMFSPIAFLIGVPWDEALQAGSFIGQKFMVNEFIAYSNFVDIKDTLTEHTQVIITFALCGFANLASIAILVGGLGALAPNRRHDIARLGFKAVVAGTLSNLMSATLAGIFISLAAY
ncbi:nucleoside permease [Psychrosphaera saromensis]|uniref:Nucleoside permease n=1 Tax=Psychrosphaera saromensis TaxID=716813 RepID=A0A2S7UTM8_9GAMM|nr:NupC/NupG family nucleoside CNT transporter [Psychrosphaera saromensis]PQJ53297.1 nucleoside transporter NupC [Psychrosphaera saromensis]GHB66582.1 nucleoside permease [Psychrosphaera saromensis]GLQ14935.1 nucleoside permease [Psychrosphaera saromensis]